MSVLRSQRRFLVMSFSVSYILGVADDLSVIGFILTRFDLLWFSNIQVFFGLSLGLQPVLQLVARLPAAGFKDLVSTFPDQIWQTFDGTTAGVRTIMNARNTLIC